MIYAITNEERFDLQKYGSETVIKESVLNTLNFKSTKDDLDLYTVDI